ncbi:2-dehydropantoate 2-reductase [Vibrio tapetis]|uniref:2-dehydropantoate 2-reductase n=1 Tax=Vibrio tapetis subsp. tapetis TaxID=1671868 RepID=A0A2N8ZC66_9VIBR|nr:2-dehydropantoate 2-reductase [Vibrio tapetis]SON49473.1 2-dehydropantoate 2-reductase [Vibrio tapetis subsp. tapetis]
MNITIVGPGAIGALWAYKLQQAGHNISLWQRKGDTSTFAIQLDNEEKITFPSNDTGLLANSDLVLITVKAWQVESAITPLLDHIHPDTILLFMHNGMGALDELEATLSSWPVLIATTTQAAFKPSKHQVHHTGNGTTQIGAWNKKGQQCAFVADVFNHALPQTSWNDHIIDALWLKLAINCAINPLTALNQCKNGALAGDRYHEQITDIINELTQVMQQQHIQFDEETLKQTIYNVITATAENYSSMQQDIQHQRVSEIDFITGYVVKCAQRHQLSVPANKQLLGSIKQIEQSWSQQ